MARKNISQIGTVSIEEVSFWRQVTSRSKGNYCWLGYPINVYKRRVSLFFDKGFKCVGCDRAGNSFAIERDALQGNNYYLQLYSLDGMIMTQDHIVPLSKGGPNTYNNLQPMCLKCNSRKADKICEFSSLKTVTSGSIHSAAS